MKVFASGSCRLLTSIHKCSQLDLLHSMQHNFIGVNFLGKFHNTQQHIQFIEWLTYKKQLPMDICKQFFTVANDRNLPCSGQKDSVDIETKRKNIFQNWNQIQVFVFEICSMKLYERDGFQLQHELVTNQKHVTMQSTDELQQGLYTLIDMLPPNAHVLFQCHFRPQVIQSGANAVPNREHIYETLRSVCDSTERAHLHDPSEMLAQDPTLYDRDTHFNHNGHVRHSQIIFKKITDLLNK